MIRPPLQDGLDDCPDENTIVAFLDGVLPDADLVTLEAHCAHCERCREGLALAARALSASVTPPSERAAAALQREIESAMHGVLRESARALALVGERIGRFEIVGVQGSGQFGVVYRARDMELARLVAVKVMRRSGRRDQPLTEALFRREAAATARLQHPNIVTLHDYGTFEGAPYLILELLEGETLRDRLDRAPPMAPRDALSIIGDVTSALVEAHAAGVIHRDIKPSNVFLCASGQVKVLDLGLALLHDLVPIEEPDPSAPAAVTWAGTPRYMAPELFRGHPSDACSDVYAVGITLLDLLTGVPGAADHESVEQRIARAHTPERLRRLLRRATAPCRADRFVDATALLAALTRERGELDTGHQVRRRPRGARPGGARSLARGGRGVARDLRIARRSRRHHRGIVQCRHDADASRRPDLHRDRGVRARARDRTPDRRPGTGCLDAAQYRLRIPDDRRPRASRPQARRGGADRDRRGGEPGGADPRHAAAG